MYFENNCNNVHTSQTEKTVFAEMCHVQKTRHKATMRGDFAADKVSDSRTKVIKTLHSTHIFPTIACAVSTRLQTL